MPSRIVSATSKRSSALQYGSFLSISTATKLVKAAKILNIPIYATTQNASRLGATVSELTSLLSDTQNVEFDKTAFSMMVPDLTAALTKQASSSPAETGKPHTPVSVILVGIETHICVTQTALDLLSMGNRVYVLADGVSSCNEGERPVALARLAREGAVVTTSESLLFELVGDAGSKDFKAISGLVKETKDETKRAVETFCKL
ncbi:hypothetical protein LTS08_004053 [Lithohypha guttulata]|nr:hypothetical protein LTS08_004053 [Lithohypha guttulata]